MKTSLHLEILPQPDDFTCGPTCLHAVYKYFGNTIPLNRIIDEVSSLEEGGTLAVHLGRHALRQGFRATIYTYNLQVFDPTWFSNPRIDLKARLNAQREAKSDAKLQKASMAYIDFLSLGGAIRFKDLNAGLIRKFLKRSIPILTGLSSTYIYREAREYVDGDRVVQDDVKGVPSGHFVVLSGYDQQSRTVTVSDPYRANPLSSEQHYSIGIDRLMNAILLGIITYDANLLVIEPRVNRVILTTTGKEDADTSRG